MVIDDLQTILNRLERRLTAEIATAQTVYGPEAASDPHRGLYLSETEVERLRGLPPPHPPFPRSQHRLSLVLGYCCSNGNSISPSSIWI
jgi:hypothetical protein